jgi:hypothetical protein
MDRRLDGPQSRSGWRGEEKILDPTGLEIRPLGLPARSQWLYRLRYTVSLNNCGISFKLFKLSLFGIYFVLIFPSFKVALS